MIVNLLIVCYLFVVIFHLIIYVINEDRLWFGNYMSVVILYLR